MPVGGIHEARKQRVRPERLRLKFRVELHRQEPGMRRKLGDLGELAVRGATGNVQSPFEQRRLVQAIELEPMPMTFVDERGAVNPFGKRALRDLARITTESH